MLLQHEWCITELLPKNSETRKCLLRNGNDQYIVYQNFRILPAPSLFHQFNTLDLFTQKQLILPPFAAS